ncbi:MAG TPA: hypothetical protein H9863_09635 [Candidatus Odoribacter faecigallinarum]|uniref:Uncharacterized protein n=1 Tax=Candidatus Odoribacter faecigallinarum TaxID=2838706 RepID=A0A9D1V1F0_9BACT|nr:hypothetical protein [Candidatus Odoribacter faecigallinarum]
MKNTLLKSLIAIGLSVCIITFYSFLPQNETEDHPEVPQTKAPQSGFWGSRTLSGECPIVDHDSWCAFACIQYFSSKEISQCELATELVDISYVGCCYPPLEDETLPGYDEYIRDYNKCFDGIKSTDFYLFASKYDNRVTAYPLYLEGDIGVKEIKETTFPCYLFIQDGADGHCAIATGVELNVLPPSMQWVVYYCDPDDGQMYEATSDLRGIFEKKLYLQMRR